MLNAVFFDMETALPPEDWNRKDPVGITCAYASMYGTTTDGTRVEIRKTWWAGMNEIEPQVRSEFDWIEQSIRSGVYPVHSAMSPNEVEEMFDGLRDLVYVDPVVREYGKPRGLFMHNGVGFDMPVIASNIPHRLDDIVDLTLKMYDPCFQAIRLYGWPIGLNAIAKAMLGMEKAEGLDGNEAANIWNTGNEESARVLRYCKGDVELTRDAVYSIMERKEIRWVTRKGTESRKPIDPPNNANPRWLSVRELIRHTYGEDDMGPIREPDRSWMDDPHAFSLRNVVGWFDYKSLFKNDAP